MVNLRLDPMEGTGMSGSLQWARWMKYAFWRFVFVLDVVTSLPRRFPPMQEPASFNLDAIKGQIE